MKGKVAIRVDGNSMTGLGHVVRSISLANMIKQDFNVFIYIKETHQSVYSMFFKYGFEVVVLESEARFFESLSGDEIVVLDGYHFDTEYEASIRSKGCLLVTIDDLHK